MNQFSVDAAKRNFRETDKYGKLISSFNSMPNQKKQLVKAYEEGEDNRRHMLDDLKRKLEEPALVPIVESK